jgi:hypothetical protein
MMFGEALAHPVYVTTIGKTFDTMSHTVCEHNTRVINKTKQSKEQLEIKEFWQ